MAMQIAPFFLRNPPGARQAGRQMGGSLKEVSPVLWRARLRQAMFKQAAFHVEAQGRVSGRRAVTHEYPKRDVPYTEDMGRAAVHYQITGYVIQRWAPRQGDANYGMMPWNYDMARDRLIAALEDGGPGRLVDPYQNRIGPQLFQCERYQVTESRDHGGYAQFEMAFVEAGQAAFAVADVNTTQQVTNTANSSMQAVQDLLNREMEIINNPSRANQPLPQNFQSILGPR